ncbi:hypothetical protein [Serratia fonticola]
MNCTNLDPRMKAEAKHAALRKTLDGLAAPVVLRS